MAKDHHDTVWTYCIVANDVAIAKVGLWLENEVVQASGVSRKHPGDKFSPVVAKELAIGRALESLGKKLQKRANGTVKQNEDNAHRVTKPLPLSRRKRKEKK